MDTMVEISGIEVDIVLDILVIGAMVVALVEVVIGVVEAEARVEVAKMVVVEVGSGRETVVSMVSLVLCVPFREISTLSPDKDSITKLEKEVGIGLRFGAGNAQLVAASRLHGGRRAAYHREQPNWFHDRAMRSALFSLLHRRGEDASNPDFPRQRRRPRSGRRNGKNGDGFSSPIRARRGD